MFTDKTIIGSIIGLLIVYLLLFSFSNRGYGYSGYYGYHSGPSFWYWGGAHYDYASQSVRNGSVGGPGRTDGISGGK